MRSLALKKAKKVSMKMSTVQTIQMMLVEYGRSEMKMRKWSNKRENKKKPLGKESQ